MNILNFLKELKNSYHKNEIIYMEGSCFRLYSILKTIFVQAKPLYSHKDGHWITEIDGKFYDINGEIDLNYIIEQQYQVVENEVILSSAYVPTYERQSVKYNKYKQT